MKCHVYEEKSKATGMTSLILHTIIGSTRTKKALKLYFKTNPQTEAEKKERREKLLLAQSIAREAELQLLNGNFQHEVYKTEYDFIAYANAFIEQHQVVDKRKYYGVINKLSAFMKKKSIPCFELTEVRLQHFAKYLSNELNGESPHNYMSKLKQIINAATADLHFRKNPAANIRVPKNVYIEKEVLTTEELRKLTATPCGNNRVKQAFLFASLTGLRWVDINRLCWKHVRADTVKLIQAKTQKGVTIPLHDDAIALLGKRGKPDDKVFTLPSHSGSLKCIRNWTKNAGIEKHLSFHCSRHFFGTALIAHGSDVSIVSKLLGHTSLANTQRYVRISENLKKQAVNNLPSIY